MSDDFDFEHTPHGFRWGPLTVQMVMSDPKLGVVIDVEAGKASMTIRASPGGRKLQVIRSAEEGGKHEQ